MASPSSNPQASATAQTAQTRKQKKALVALVALFSSGAVGYGLMLGIRTVLMGLGLSTEIAHALANLASSKTDFPNFDVGEIGPMQKLERRQSLAWRALYVIAAAERLHDAQDFERAFQREHSYFLRHLAAEERRLRAAALVDVASRLLDDRTEEQETSKVPLLGWRSVIDQRTTPECKWANGQNFRADRIPVIGLPGAVHPRCRCTSGPPVEGAPLLPSV